MIVFIRCNVVRLIFHLHNMHTVTNSQQVSHTHTHTHTHTQLHKDTPSIQASVLTPVTPVSPSRKLLSIVQQNQLPFGSPEHLATFVVTTLFDALAGFLYTKEKSRIDVNDSMMIWHNVYR